MADPAQSEASAAADDVTARYDRAREAMQLGREAIGHARGLLTELLTEISDARSRGTINRQIWEAARIAGDYPQFFSQAGQDAYLDEQVFYEKRGGTFVEIGGYDGITGSNCLFFELARNWTGLLVEPAPTHFKEAAAFRRCTCLPVAVGGADGKASFLNVEQGYRQMSGLVDSYDPELRRQVEEDARFEGGVIETPVKSLDSLLSEAHLEAVDYISMDVEGAELVVLKAFPFEKYQITAWSIESSERDRQIPELMEDNGYRRVEALGTDDLYVFGAGQV